MQVEFTGFAYKIDSYTPIEAMLKGEKMPSVFQEEIKPGGQYTKDWAKVGIVRVIVEFDDENTIVANQIEALKQQLHTVRAENEMRERAVIDKIKNLEALTYESKE